jgi:hypothetical protein
MAQLLDLKLGSILFVGLKIFKLADFACGGALAIAARGEHAERDAGGAQSTTRGLAQDFAANAWQ